MIFKQEDKRVLRKLAEKLRAFSGLEMMREREERWTALNDLRCPAPLLLTSPEGAWREIDMAFTLECVDEQARRLELDLRRRIYKHEMIGDDSVIAPVLEVGWNISDDGFGVELRKESSDSSGGSYRHIAPIASVDEGLRSLKFRRISVDRDATSKCLEAYSDAVGDILDVRIGGQYFWTTGLTWTAIELIGLENLMLWMFDDPDGLRMLMKFLSDEMSNYMAQLENLGLLSYNNGNNLIGSGNWGLTSQLPSGKHPGGNPVRLKDLWGFCESQETVGVSPGMFGDFIWPHQKPLMEKFGLTYYGCCEPVEERFEYIRTVKNLRCISVSPWSNPEKCAELYGRNYVLCCKPNPGNVCVNFNEAEIRRETRRILDCTRGLNVMFILTDTHTISNAPERFGRWCRIVRSEIGC